MDLEKLTCIQCKAEWNRPKSRGRKPKLCPSCLQSPVESVNPEPLPEKNKLFSKKQKEPNNISYPANTKWQCTTCGVSVVTGITITHIPTHSCKKRLSRILPLEQIF